MLWTLEGNKAQNYFFSYRVLTVATPQLTEAFVPGFSKIMCMVADLFAFKKNSSLYGL